LGVRFLKFDADRDGERLKAAGYAYRYIPFFVVPRADGTASARAMEGSVKGAAAVADDLVPRLRAMLGRK
jgi:hypothetical protein